MRGRIKVLAQTFGFIRGDDAVDYFFHQSDQVEGDVELSVGDVVTFEVVEPQPEKGPRAQLVAWQEGKP